MRRLSGEDKAGLYITVIVHLTVIIVCLLIQINAALQSENSFVIDFSKQEEARKLKEEAERQESVSRRIDEMLASAGTPIRNVAVDRGSLKDDRGTDAEKLYKDAERLSRELKNGQNSQEDADAVDMSRPEDENQAQDQKKVYKGPSVVSYQLDGRKASSLKIPAYRCMGAGEVEVIITVDPQGRVLKAVVNDSVSAADACLREFAVRAARLSRFSAKATAPARQTGNIVYEFIAQ